MDHNTKGTNMTTIAASAFRAPPAATMLLMAAMLSTGAAGLVMEYVLATVSTYVLGNSIEQWSIVIAVMLLSMGIAAHLQKKLGDTHLIEKFVAVEVLLAILGGFAPLIIYAAYAYMETHFAIALYGTVGMIGFLIGLEIPIVIRINEKYVGELKANLGWILSMDFVGGFVGAVIWVKFLLANFPLTEISFIVAGFNFAVALVTTCYFARTGAIRMKAAVAVSVLVTLAVLAFGWNVNRQWSVSIEQRLYDQPIVHAETTKYQRIVLTHDARLDDWRLYLNGGLQFSSVDEPIYHEHLVHPVMALAPRRERVLILGGGDGLALREVLKYDDVRSVTLVDIDPRMIELASTNEMLRALNHDSFRDARVNARATDAVVDDGFRTVSMEREGGPDGAPPDQQDIATVRVFTMDAMRFLGDAETDSWDVVIIDFPDPDQVELAKLYSREFYRMLGNRLAPDGLIAIQATSPYHAREAFLCIGRTLQAGGISAVPYHANVPSFGDWGWYIGSTSRSADALRTDLQQIESFPVPLRYLTPELTRASLAFGQEALTPEFSGVNSIMEPVLLQYYTHHAWQQE